MYLQLLKPGDMQDDKYLINSFLVNYELSSSTSSSINYLSNQSSSSPESFPELMENGILVKYEQVFDQSTSDQSKESAKPKLAEIED